MKVPQREIIACLFHSERKQKSEEMGPPRDVGSRGLSGPAPNGYSGVRRWITSFAEEETRAQLGPLQLKQVRLHCEGGSAFSKAHGPTTVVSSYTATRYKNTSAGGSRDRDKGPDGSGGWVQNYQRAGCGLGLTSRQSKPPGLHPCPGYQRAQKETREVGS